MAYREFNPNPKKRRRACDYVIRAAAKATGKTWLEVYDRLTAIGREQLVMPNEDRAYRMFFESEGFKYTGLKARRGESRPTVRSFAEEHPEGIYVLSLAGHLVALVDGNWFDTWDCGYKCVYCYWELPE